MITQRMDQRFQVTKRVGLLMLMIFGIGLCCGDLPATQDEQTDTSSTGFRIAALNAASQDEDSEKSDPAAAEASSTDQAIAALALTHWWRNSTARDEINVTSGCTNCHHYTDLDVDDATRRAHLDLYGLPPEIWSSAGDSRQTPLSAVELTVPDTLTRQLLNLPADSGIVVERLCPLFVQALGLLNENDVILEINGQPAQAPADFAQAIRNRVSDQPVTLSVRRAGEAVTLELGDTGDSATAESEKNQRPIIGVQIAEAAPVVRAQLKLPESARVVIESVVPDSPAARAGLTLGDFVLKVGDTDIADVSDLQNAVTESGGQELTLQVLRDGESLAITVEPAPRHAVFPETSKYESAKEPYRQFMLDPAQYRYQLNGNLMIPMSAIEAWMRDTAVGDVTLQRANMNVIDELVLQQLRGSADALPDPADVPASSAESDSKAIHANIKQLQEQLEELTNAVNRLSDAVAKDSADQAADRE